MPSSAHLAAPTKNTKGSWPMKDALSVPGRLGAGKADELPSFFLDSNPLWGQVAEVMPDSCPASLGSASGGVKGLREKGPT